MGDEMRAGWRKLPEQCNGHDQWTCRADDSDIANGVVYWARGGYWHPTGVIATAEFGVNLDAAMAKAEQLLRESGGEPGAFATCKLCGHRGAFPSVVALFPDAELLDAGGPDRVLRCCDAVACAGRRESGGEVAKAQACAMCGATDRIDGDDGFGCVCSNPEACVERRRINALEAERGGLERDLREVRAAHQACAASLAEALRERDSFSAIADAAVNGVERMRVMLDAANARVDAAERERDKLAALLDDGEESPSIKAARDQQAEAEQRMFAMRQERDAAEREVERLKARSGMRIALPVVSISSSNEINLCWRWSGATIELDVNADGRVWWMHRDHEHNVTQGADTDWVDELPAQFWELLRSASERSGRRLFWIPRITRAERVGRAAIEQPARADKTTGANRAEEKE